MFLLDPDGEFGAGDSAGPLSDFPSHKDGLACHTEALGLSREISAPREEADALEGIGQCHLQAGDIGAGAPICCRRWRSTDGSVLRTLGAFRRP